MKHQFFGPPSPGVLAQLEDALKHDMGLHGEIWRATKNGISDDEIKRSRGASYPNFIWNYRRSMKALLQGDLPNRPTLLNDAALLFRRYLKLDELHEDTRRYLESGLIEILQKMNDDSARLQEEQGVVKQSKLLQKKSTPGIYVYSLMHYLRFPYDQNTGRTLMKVGRSDRDVIKRFKEQVRTTALPEEPILLRIYEDEKGSLQLLEVEKKFHALLEAADHDRSAARTGGTEWFLTSLKFLDEIGSTLSLNITHNADLSSTDSEI